MPLNSVQPPRTKIVATLGPACATSVAMSQMIEAGLDVARLNFSHGTHREHAGFIRLMRQAAARAGKSVAVMQDLPGPKNRTGKLKKGQVELKAGATFVLTTGELLGDDRKVSVGIPTLARDVSPGNVILLGDGAIKLEVIKTDGRSVWCRVLAGGPLGEDKGINVPGISYGVPSFTGEDKEHLLFGLKHKVDFVAVSFITGAQDILRVRKFLIDQGESLPIIAKIEKQEALDHIDEIIQAADCVMVARGDLGLEIPIEKVPTAQKEIIRKCNERGKPVIVATQMLESMVRGPSPTRAEVTDIANAVIDGADALMLSEETAIGKYPVEALVTMAKVASEAERNLPYSQILVEREKGAEKDTNDAISHAACYIADQLSAAAIIAFTSSGGTARRVAKYRPAVPILAITPSQAVQRKLCVSWGVETSRVPRASNLSVQFSQGAKIAKEKGLAQPGDLVVITGGVPLGVPGTTNLLKVERVK